MSRGKQVGLSRPSFMSRLGQLPSHGRNGEPDELRQRRWKPTDLFYRLVGGVATILSAIAKVLVALPAGLAGAMQDWFSSHRRSQRQA